jgi:PhnB protein
MNIPQDHQQVMVYLIIKDAAAFATFVQDLFGGKLLNAHMREDGVTIMHGEIRVGDSTIMFAESTDEYPVQTSHFFVYVEDADRSHQMILESGGSSVTEVTDQPYGRSGGAADKFGNTWWVTSIGGM